MTDDFTPDEDTLGAKATRVDLTKDLSGGIKSGGFSVGRDRLLVFWDNLYKEELSGGDSGTELSGRWEVRPGDLVTVGIRLGYSFKSYYGHPLYTVKDEVQNKFTFEDKYGLFLNDVGAKSGKDIVSRRLNGIGGTGGGLPRNTRDGSVEFEEIWDLEELSDGERVQQVGDWLRNIGCFPYMEVVVNLEDYLKIRVEDIVFSERLTKIIDYTDKGGYFTYDNIMCSGKSPDIYGKTEDLADKEVEPGFGFGLIVEANMFGFNDLDTLEVIPGLYEMRDRNSWFYGSFAKTKQARLFPGRHNYPKTMTFPVVGVIGTLLEVREEMVWHYDCGQKLTKCYRILFGNYKSGYMRKPLWVIGNPVVKTSGNYTLPIVLPI